MSQSIFKNASKISYAIAAAFAMGAAAAPTWAETVDTSASRISFGSRVEDREIFSEVLNGIKEQQPSALTFESTEGQSGANRFLGFALGHGNNFLEITTRLTSPQDVKTCEQGGPSISSRGELVFSDGSVDGKDSKQIMSSEASRNGRRDIAVKKCEDAAKRLRAMSRRNELKVTAKCEIVPVDVEIIETRKVKKKILVDVAGSDSNPSGQFGRKGREDGSNAGRSPGQGSVSGQFGKAPSGQNAGRVSSQDGNGEADSTADFGSSYSDRGAVDPTKSDRKSNRKQKEVTIETTETGPVPAIAHQIKLVYEFESLQKHRIGEKDGGTSSQSGQSGQNGRDSDPSGSDDGYGDYSDRGGSQSGRKYKRDEPSEQSGRGGASGQSAQDGRE